MTRAAGALHYYERKQEVLAHNLANASTNGFKAERIFGRAVGNANPVADRALDLREGAVRPTGEPLDIALQGQDFLVVQTGVGERLTRGGSLRLDAAGRLVDQAGNAVLGDTGEIVLPPGDIRVSEDGTIRVDDRRVTALRVERPLPGADILSEEGGLFVAGADRAAVPAEQRRVLQGSLEESNMSPLEAMVDMISVQRAFAAVQSTVITLDGVRDTIANQLARPV